MAGEIDISFEEFVELHKPQLIKSAIPERIWNSLFQKLKKEIFDAGDSFMIQKVLLESDSEPEECDDKQEEEDCMETDNTEAKEPSGVYEWQVVVHNEEGVSVSDENQVYLIDHAWTYRTDKAKQQLEHTPGLSSRLANLMDIPQDKKDKSQLIDDIFNEMWKFNQTYSIANAEHGSGGALPIWYLMDEFGSRIQHSDDPSVKVVPFFYHPLQISFSVLWLLRDLDYGDELTRDYVEGSNVSQDLRKFKLLPWRPEEFAYLDCQPKPIDQDFIMKYQPEDTLPMDESVPPFNSKIKIYINVTHVESNFVPDDQFELAENVDEADVLWLQDNFHDFRSLYTSNQPKFINQFPNESVLIAKDIMASVVLESGTFDEESLETTPAWFETSYNLATELPEFVSHFQRRDARGLNNLWICKPWNLGRGLDLHITDNLNYILRLPETGPKIASKYITNPVLLEMGDKGPLKFDLRYIVLLKSVKPLKLMVHRTFSIRMADKEFSLDNFDDVVKHTTVLNYVENVNIDLISPEEYIEKFTHQYPEYNWEEVETDIHQCLRELFQAVTKQEAPKGIRPCSRSRAIYGIDVILKWVKDKSGADKIQPVILEANFIPDTTRQVHYRKEFYNDVFHALFLDDIKDRPITVL